MEIIGRKNEQDVLAQAMESQKPEFIVVYGRRRVGKTYLIKEFFNNQFAFYALGIPDQKSNKAKSDMLTRPIEAGASCSREATLSDITGYPRVPRGSNDL